MGISLYRSIESQYQNLRRINNISMMNVISHQIEDQVIQHQIPTDFYAGFQRFSHFPEQLRRYSRLGAVCRRVYVFGIADCEPPNIPGIEFIELSPTSPLALEWFLLVDTPGFWVTLVAQETNNRDSQSRNRNSNSRTSNSRNAKGRDFDAVWSYDAEVVDRISLLMSQRMETPYLPTIQRDYAQQNLHISEMSCRMVDLLEKSENQGQRRWSQLHTLHSLSELSANTLMELLQTAAKILLDIFGATSVVVALKVSDEHYKIVVADGDAAGRGWKLEVDEGLCGQAMESVREIHISDVSQNRQYESLMPGARALIAAPMVNRKVHGAILVGNATAQSWTEEDAETISAVAKLLAVQVEQKLILAARKSNPSSSQSSSAVRKPAKNSVYS